MDKRLVLASVLALVAAAGCKKARSTSTEDSTEKASGESTEAKAIDGVTNDEIKIGMVGMFSGTLAQYGIESWRGAQALFLEVNSKGGVHGRQIKLVAKDDAYDSAKAPIVMKEMLAQEDPFLIFNQTGTGTTASTLPILAENKAKNLMVFANFTGGPKPREQPAIDQFFHIRASYAAEAKELVDMMVAAGKTKFGIYFQEDAYGKSVSDGLKAALAAHKLTPVAEVPYKTGTKFEEPAVEAVKKLKAANCDVVLMGAVYQPAAGWVRDAREMGWNVPVATNSVTTDTMLRYMNAYETKNKKTISNHVIWSSVVPNYEDATNGLVREYRDLMDKRNPKVPADLQDPNYRSLQYSFSALEGYLDAKVLVHVLEKAGKNLTRTGFKQAAESVTNFDPGLGAMIDLSNHMGVKAVWLVGAKNGQFVSLGSSVMKSYLDDATASAATPGPAGKTVPGAPAAPPAKH